MRNAQNTSSCTHDRPLNEGNFSLRIVKLNIIAILHSYTATGFEADDGGRNNHLPVSSELQPRTDDVVLTDVEKTPEEEVQQNPPPPPGLWVHELS